MQENCSWINFHVLSTLSSLVMRMQKKAERDMVPEITVLRSRRFCVLRKDNTA